MSGRRARQVRRWKATHPDWRQLRARREVREAFKRLQAVHMRLLFGSPAAHRKFFEALQDVPATGWRAYENTFPVDLQGRNDEGHRI